MDPRKNPFPGMNPFLEIGHWDDFRSSLVVYASERLQESLPDGLYARIAHRTFLARAFADMPDAPYRPPRTDRIVMDRSPVRMKQSYLNIVASEDHPVITRIELVTRGNRRTIGGRERYRRHRSGAMRARVNIVEIDLLRGGTPVTLCHPGLLLPSHRTPFHVSVYRASKPGQIEYYPAPLRSPLPTIRIPLRPGEADATLDLQAVIEMYHRGRITDLDYARPLDPPLSPEDAAWVAEIVHRSEGSRDTH